MKYYHLSIDLLNDKVATFWCYNIQNYWSKCNRSIQTPNLRYLKKKLRLNLKVAGTMAKILLCQITIQRFTHKLLRYFTLTVDRDADIESSKFSFFFQVYDFNHYFYRGSIGQNRLTNEPFFGAVV